MENVINFEERSRGRLSKTKRLSAGHGDNKKGNVILFTGVRIQYQKSLDRALSSVRSVNSNNAER